MKKFLLKKYLIWKMSTICTSQFFYSDQAIILPVSYDISTK